MSASDVRAARPPRPAFLDELRVPVIAAPMLIVSGPALVIAEARAGIAAAFPTTNARGEGELAAWLDEIDDALAQARDRGERPAPYVPNLIVHPTNERLGADLDAVVRRRPPVVIASVGSPARVIPRLHDHGIQVWSDVASVHHAERALEAGADGLVLLCAGAGGQTGSANPFSFVRRVRAMFDGVIAVAGGIADGWAVFAVRALGADLAYMGTRFIAAAESNAPEGYRRMVVDSELDDVQLTNALTGLQTNMLTKSLLAQGIDPAELGMVDRGFSMDALTTGREDRPKQWRDLWSAGHSVSGVGAVAPAARIVDELAEQYGAARAAVDA